MPGHFLDVLLDRFSVKNVPIGQALRVLRHLMNPAFPDRDRGGTGNSIGTRPGENTQARVQKAEALFNRPVTLSIRHATPRQILNRLVAQHGELFWVATSAKAPGVEKPPVLSRRTARFPCTPLPMCASHGPTSPGAIS